ncbi:MAG: LysM peptidoglycan-binding domain-containing protein, partial [Bacillota bacterium]
RANEALRPDALRYGTVLTIPHKGWCDRGGELTQAPKPPRFRYAEYVVQTDDTLYGISLRCGLTMRILQKANGLSGVAELQPGMRLRIPVISGKRYYAREGESLAEIAARHNVTEDALREKNFLEFGERIGPGACLLI